MSTAAYEMYCEVKVSQSHALNIVAVIFSVFNSIRHPDNDFIGVFESDCGDDCNKKINFVRAYKSHGGSLLSQFKYHSPETLQAFGRFIAQIAKILRSISYYYLKPKCNSTNVLYRHSARALL